MIWVYIVCPDLSVQKLRVYHRVLHPDEMANSFAPDQTAFSGTD